MLNLNKKTINQSYNTKYLPGPTHLLKTSVGPGQTYLHSKIVGKYSKESKTINVC